MAAQPDFTAFRPADPGYVVFNDNPCIRTLTVPTKYGLWFVG
ncbi:MAG: hypothetical protein WCF26_14080 [Candidatus Sulfotelmatobacter sp.]